MITIIIPTVGRIESLRSLLKSLVETDNRHQVEHEVLVVNNATERELPAQVSMLADEFGRTTDLPVRCLREPVPGKSRAVNKAIAFARGSVLAFLDDDVVVGCGWLSGVRDFFLHHEFDAMQGAILFPPGKEADVEFLRVWNRYRTIVHVNYGENVKDFHKLTGANFAIRRQVIERVGLFDERIGPGQTGTSEDSQFGKKLLKSGLRIGYAPQARVYHEIDSSRLTHDYFRRQHEAQGVSRQTYKKNSVLRIVPDLCWAIANWGWYSLLKNERGVYRSEARVYHYRAMLTQWFCSR
jgi:GT2 family glycosyltransferase